MSLVDRTINSRHEGLINSHLTINHITISSARSFTNQIIIKKFVAKAIKYYENLSRKNYLIEIPHAKIFHMPLRWSHTIDINKTKL